MSLGHVKVTRSTNLVLHTRSVGASSLFQKRVQPCQLRRASDGTAAYLLLSGSARRQSRKPLSVQEPPTAKSSTISKENAPSFPGPASLNFPSVHGWGRPSMLSSKVEGDVVKCYADAPDVGKDAPLNLGRVRLSMLAQKTNRVSVKDIPNGSNMDKDLHASKNDTSTSLTPTLPVPPINRTWEAPTPSKSEGKENHPDPSLENSSVSSTPTEEVANRSPAKLGWGSPTFVTSKLKKDIPPRDGPIMLRAKDVSRYPLIQNGWEHLLDTPLNSLAMPTKEALGASMEPEPESPEFFALGEADDFLESPMEISRDIAAPEIEDHGVNPSKKHSWWHSTFILPGASEHSPRRSGEYGWSRPFSTPEKVQAIPSPPIKNGWGLNALAVSRTDQSSLDDHEILAMKAFQEARLIEEAQSKLAQVPVEIQQAREVQEAYFSEIHPHDLVTEFKAWYHEPLLTYQRHDAHMRSALRELSSIMFHKKPEYGHMLRYQLCKLALNSIMINHYAKYIARSFFQRRTTMLTPWLQTSCRIRLRYVQEPFADVMESTKVLIRLHETDGRISKLMNKYCMNTVALSKFRALANRVRIGLQRDYYHEHCLDAELQLYNYLAPYLEYPCWLDFNIAWARRSLLKIRAWNNISFDYADGEKPEEFDSPTYRAVYTYYRMLIDFWKEIYRYNRWLADYRARLLLLDMPEEDFKELGQRIEGFGNP